MAEIAFSLKREYGPVYLDDYYLDNQETGEFNPNSKSSRKLNLGK